MKKAAVPSGRDGRHRSRRLFTGDERLRPADEASELMKKVRFTEEQMVTILREGRQET